MYNREKFIELIYNSKNNNSEINYLKAKPFISFNRCHQSAKLALSQIVYETENDHLDEPELSICLMVAMLIVNSDYAQSDIPFEERFGDFCSRNFQNETRGKVFLHYHNFKDPTFLKQFYCLAKDIIEQEGPCNMTQLFSDILDWNTEESAEERWTQAMIVAGSKKYTEANGYCAYNKNPEDRDCHACSLSSYGNDCHCRPIE